MKVLILILFFFTCKLVAKTIFMPWPDQTQRFSFSLEQQWKDSGSVMSSTKMFEYSRGKTRDLLSILVAPKKIREFTLSRQLEQQRYEQMKREWAKQRGITLVHFFPLHTLAKKQYQQYVFGVQYAIAKRTLNEFSLYHVCNGKIIFMKVLGSAKDDVVARTVKQIGKSFRCYE